MAHRKGEEADALAALSRALREGGLPTSQPAKNASKHPKALAAEDTAAAAAAAAPAVEAKAERKPKKDKKDKKEKMEKKDKDKKRKHAQPPPAEPAEQAPDAVPSGGDNLAAAAALLSRLEQAAGALRSAVAAEAARGLAHMAERLATLAGCTAELCAALAAAGCASADLPPALLVLQAQVQQLQALSSRLPLPPAPLPPPQLEALTLQAEAAAAGVRQRLAEGGSIQQQQQHAAGPAGTPLHPEEQQALRGWYLPTFADCFAAEVEALQESEPPIPAGVLLQCVRLAADSTALFPPHLARLVLAGSGSSSG
ncbi:hypothetical protein ABPG75_009519 [Micractinium tetrahymenae]